MKNNFSEETRQLFDFGGYSVDWDDGLNDADCLHHVLSRVSNSPYNAVPLNNFRNHQPEGRSNQGLPGIHTIKVEKRYLIKTKSYLDSIGYKPNKKDLEFLDKYKEYYL